MSLELALQRTAADPGFSNIIESAGNITGASYNVSTTLGNNTTYYWRVTGQNNCGNGLPSATFRPDTSSELTEPVIPAASNSAIRPKPQPL